jgi:hypothetical protein
MKFSFLWYFLLNVAFQHLYKKKEKHIQNKSLNIIPNDKERIKSNHSRIERSYWPIGFRCPNLDSKQSPFNCQSLSYHGHGVCKEALSSVISSFMSEWARDGLLYFPSELHGMLRVICDVDHKNLHHMQRLLAHTPSQCCIADWAQTQLESVPPS